MTPVTTHITPGQSERTEDTDVMTCTQPSMMSFVGVGKVTNALQDNGQSKTASCDTEGSDICSDGQD